MDTEESWMRSGVAREGNQDGANWNLVRDASIG
jgi:hypothetical protein